MGRAQFNGAPEPVEEDADDAEDEDGEDPLSTLMAGLLLIMTCPDCEGTGAIERGSKTVTRCPCRDFGHALAIEVLKDEGRMS